MATYLLTWNPKRFPWDDLADDIAAVHEYGLVPGRWSCGGNKSIRAGDRFFLIRLGKEPRGLVGSGFVETASFEDDHWDPVRYEAGIPARYVNVRFDVILDAEQEAILDMDLLKNAPVLSRMHWSSQTSGVHIPDNIAVEVEKYWPRLVGSPVLLAEEVSPAQPHVEGSVHRVLVNAYERNSKARKQCIDHHGVKCVVCGFDFAQGYGEAGSGYIQVHHLVSLSSIGHEYEVDPIRDLRPVCPNCHAIIHRRIPAYTIDEMKAILESAAATQP